MKKTLLLAVVCGLCLLRANPPSRAGTGDLTLADAPRGTWLATVRSDAPLSVLEERDGWKRVRIEGWLPGGSVTPGETPPPAISRSGDAGASSPGTGAGVAVRGVLLPTDGSASTGSGLIVLLLSDLGSLETDHRRMGEECTARVREVDSRIDRLESELAKALNSSENFREATQRNDRLKGDIRDAHKERGDRLAECRRSADGLFDRHAIRRSISDARGTFEFDRVPPGRYRVVATEAGKDLPRAWSLECVVGGTEAVVLDPRRDRSPVEPYWGLR
jgi:hypothetical protein